MIEYNNTNNTCKIVIPVSDVQEILRYQRGVLGLLRKIELDTCGPTLKDDVKAVFELLGHMLSADNMQQLEELKKLRRGSRKSKPGFEKQKPGYLQRSNTAEAGLANKK
jgi:hypothetical protein